jgi:MFS family permease
MPYAVLMPVFAKDILKSGSDVLGFLMASTGVGALAGGMFLANRKAPTGFGKIMAFATIIFGSSLLLFSFSRNLWISLGLLLFVGFGMITMIATANTFLQTITEDKMRGRVMSYFTMAFIGTSPFGGLLSGAAADKIGAPHTVMISGIIIAICSIVFFIRLPALRKLARPVCIKKGIIVEVARGINAASELDDLNKY